MFLVEDAASEMKIEECIFPKACRWGTKGKYIPAVVGLLVVGDGGVSQVCLVLSHGLVVSSVESFVGLGMVH